jgi:para-aminobenzoate synthetase/4-amino-4-deoxychorismate lyase
VTRARLIVEPLAVDWSPPQAALALRGDAHPVVLSGAWAGGSTIVASEPVLVARPDEDPFALLDELPVVDGDAPPGALGGGWLGYLGFALGHLVERLPPPAPDRGALPPFALAYYDHLLRRDADGRWWFEALQTPQRAEAIAARRAELAARRPVAEPFSAGPFAPTPPGTTGLRTAVAECVQRIAAGELFQANLTLRLDGPFEGDPLDAFATGLAVRPAYGAYVGGPWGAYLGLSPELFLRRTGREVVTRPIKGTRPRVAGAREELEASVKDHAENVMIVDLMRNDLGRVARYGSVQADPVPVAEPHPGVWHLVSTVRGRLRDDVCDAQLLRATFPPGSVTGAPKVQALRVISELEGTARHAYTGAAGFASPLAGLELDVTIRTFEIAGGTAWIGAGGGIVADSDPDAEVREALDKARPLIAALGAQLHADPSPTRPRPGLPHALDAGRQRPDPRAGVIETLAVDDHRPVALDLHLERVAASAARVLDVELPVTLEAEIVAAAQAAPPGRHRLRIDVTPDGTTFALHAAAPASLDPIAVAPVVLPGGLGAHKWRDRALVEALAQRLGAIPLLVDADGAVLEAAHANLFLVEGDQLLTPPADGRLLPGVTRARVIAATNAVEAPIDLDRLDAADAAFLSSSIALVRVIAGSRHPEWAKRVLRCLRDDLELPMRPSCPSVP